MEAAGRPTAFIVGGRLGRAAIGLLYERGDAAEVRGGGWRVRGPVGRTARRVRRQRVRSGTHPYTGTK